MEKNGAELLRLWAAAGDYQSDIVFSKTILDQLGESYRKIRNTCRYLLSNLYDFVPRGIALDDQDPARAGSAGAGRAARARPPDLRRLPPVSPSTKGCGLIVDYVVTVSAEYLDPIKDALYCEGAGSKVRRSAQTALYEMVRTIATWIAPILCFSAQDVADELGAAPASPSTCTGRRGPSWCRWARPCSRPTSAGWTRSGPRREQILRPARGLPGPGATSRSRRR
jgi:isoleucyl-tRNA synthetase